MKHTQIQKSAAGAVCRLADSRSEQTVEAQCVLPDFLPDILRVIGCRAQALVCDRRIAQDKVIVDGTLRFEALCVSPEGELFCATQTAAWQKAVDAVLPIGSVIFDNARTVSCRARPVSAKKIDFSAVVALQLTALGPQQEEILCHVERDDVQLRRVSLPCDRFCGGTSRQFSLSEDLELNGDAPSVERILSVRAHTDAIRASAADGTVTVSGNVKVTVLYSADLEAGVPTRVTYTLPFEQTLEVDGATADCRCRTALSLCSYSLTTRTGADGLVRAFALDYVLNAAVCCSRPDALECVGDAYSTRFESSCDRRLLSVSCNGRRVTDLPATVSLFSGGRLPVRITDADACVTALRLQAHPEAAEQTLLIADVLVSVIGIDQAGDPVHLEQHAEVTSVFTVPADAELLPEATVTSVSAGLSGEGVEVRIELETALEVSQFAVADVLTDLTVDEQKPHSANRAPLILCYGAAGESLFDIAKHYRTAPDAIAAQNALETDELPQPMMLVIPTL
ncbi:MAG: DUF3794 domain-containing protein [Clostridia bacterium]|nr:DUF3794 domain-containing protein [Clostridia bacterium]